jgi:putative transposase
MGRPRSALIHQGSPLIHQGAASVDRADHPHRGLGRPPRLRGWDYSSAGAYFVTFVVRNRHCCLGETVGSEMRLSQWGEIAQQCWVETPLQFPSVSPDSMQVMPNHVHAIAWLAGGALNNQGGALINQGSTNNQGHLRPIMADPRLLLGKVVRAWKAQSTRLIRVAGYPDFAWQSRYYDHIVRNDSELERIRSYIENNPARWAEDKENPERTERP